MFGKSPRFSFSSILVDFHGGVGAEKYGLSPPRTIALSLVGIANYGVLQAFDGCCGIKSSRDRQSLAAEDDTMSFTTHRRLSKDIHLKA